MNSHAPARSRRRFHCKACELERATVRAAVSKEDFGAIEALRTFHPTGEEQDEAFWRAMRERVIALATESPQAALTTLRARVGRVCAALGMSVDDADKLILGLDPGPLVQAAESNHSILEFRSDRHYQDCWSVESMRRNTHLWLQTNVFSHYFALSKMISAPTPVRRHVSDGIILRLRDHVSYLRLVRPGPGTRKSSSGCKRRLKTAERVVHDALGFALFTRSAALTPRSCAMA